MNLEFKNITVDMGQRRILDNVSLRVEPGTVTGLIGPNGSGKSTLFKTAYRVQPPTQGAVFAGGEGRGIPQFSRDRTTYRCDGAGNQLRLSADRTRSGNARTRAPPARIWCGFTARY